MDKYIIALFDRLSPSLSDSLILYSLPENERSTLKSFQWALIMDYIHLKE